MLSCSQNNLIASSSISEKKFKSLEIKCPTNNSLALKKYRESDVFLLILLINNRLKTQNSIIESDNELVKILLKFYDIENKFFFFKIISNFLFLKVKFRCNGIDCLKKKSFNIYTNISRDIDFTIYNKDISFDTYEETDEDIYFDTYEETYTHEVNISEIKLCDNCISSWIKSNKCIKCISLGENQIDYRYHQDLYETWEEKEVPYIPPCEKTLKHALLFDLYEKDKNEKYGQIFFYLDENKYSDIYEKIIQGECSREENVNEFEELNSDEEIDFIFNQNDSLIVYQ